MKKIIQQQPIKIYSGFVLETRESEEASARSYDDMKIVGHIRLGESIEIDRGDDLNDCPYNCNGSIYDGEEIAVEKGDVVIIIKK